MSQLAVRCSDTHGHTRSSRATWGGKARCAVSKARDSGDTIHTTLGLVAALVAHKTARVSAAASAAGATGAAGHSTAAASGVASTPRSEASQGVTASSSVAGAGTVVSERAAVSPTTPPASAQAAPCSGCGNAGWVRPTNAHSVGWCTSPRACFTPSGVSPASNTIGSTLGSRSPGSAATLYSDCPCRTKCSVTRGRRSRAVQSVR